MTLWRIRRYIDGVWDGVAPQAVTAETMADAAEIFLGSNVKAEGPEGAYSVAVWRAGDIPVPTYFWANVVPRRAMRLRDHGTGWREGQPVQW